MPPTAATTKPNGPQARRDNGDRPVFCPLFLPLNLKMNNKSLSPVVIVLLAFLLAASNAHANEHSARQEDWTLQDGRLMVDDEWVFLKIGNPLRNFANPGHCHDLIDDLDLLKAKGYNTFVLNCYWHHFDTDGDGQIDVSLEPLAKLIDAIHARGMFPCLSVETYAVGGGKIPGGFWEKNSEAVAVDSNGRPVRDDEYGFNTAVPSLFHEEYLAASRRFIRNLTKGLPHRKILHYETTVEPQFMGRHDIGYSDAAKRAYEKWIKDNNIDGPAWPETFPFPESFRHHPVWLRFRAESLADWINRDGQAFRSVAGNDAYIAVDYLEAGSKTMYKRNGDSIQFLTALTSPDIIQVNWHWHLGRRAPNTLAYENVRKVMDQTGRDWAISEHMTLNGSDFRPEEVERILMNALKNGTCHSFAFVNVNNSTRDGFSLYHDDWSPKPLIAEVDRNWAHWKQVIAKSKASSE